MPYSELQLLTVQKVGKHFPSFIQEDSRLQITLEIEL